MTAEEFKKREELERVAHAINDALKTVDKEDPALVVHALALVFAGIGLHYHQVACLVQIAIDAIRTMHNARVAHTAPAAAMGGN